MRPNHLCVQKVVDEKICFRRPRGATLREEVWQTAKGKVTKCNLAYINPLVCHVDNGRVLGYDNSHGYHHRHFMGQVEPFDFAGYDALAEKFYEEVDELRKADTNG